MYRPFLLATFSASALVLSACGNTVYGPARLVGAGSIDNGSGSANPTCPPTVSPTPAPTAQSSIDLTADFFMKACESYRDHTNPDKARTLINAGVTLNRLRCSDFFRERGANQTRSRVIRRTVAPLSALITSVLGIVDFSSDDGRAEALEILGIAQAASLAGLEVYESEFLFGSTNIRSVEELTLRDLDVHARQIMGDDRRPDFYQALRDMIDHQSKCRPTHILQLAQSAIRNGNIETQQTAATRNESAQLAAEFSAATSLADMFQRSDLTDNEIGTLWWLTQPSLPSSSKELALARARLGDSLGPLLISQVGSTYALSSDATAILPLVRARISTLSPRVTASFVVTRSRLVSVAAAAASESAAIVSASAINFATPTGLRPSTNGATETGVAPLPEGG